MYNPNVTKAVPLSNGNPTTAVPAALLSTQVYLPDGNCVTLQEIVKNKESYDGKTISKEQGTSSGGIWKIFVKAENVYALGKKENLHLNPKLDYSSLSDTKNIAAIEKNVINAAYVTSSETIAKGEWTVVFSKPNAGKTLITLATVAKQISNGIINGDDVFYFNLDDARPGYLEKLKILKPLNVIVLDQDPVGIMINLINNQQAKDKVVIIDTLIRVCDTNNRQEIISYSGLFKRFTELGGTVITLAHANKYLDKKTGAPILEGVGLIRNNAHCVCYLQKFDDIIKMVNIKKRTNVKTEVTFQIAMDLPYPDLFNSVHTLTGNQATQLFKDRKRNQLAKDHDTIVKTIQETIFNGINQRTALAKAVHDNTGDFKKTIFIVLDELEGKLWKMTRGPNNSMVYSII
jgi:archaellum biogenesis ATPase FlaH